jgi:hypothetical protein
MSYPGASIINFIVRHADENVTTKMENNGISVVATIPRLTPRATISFLTVITGDPSYNANHIIANCVSGILCYMEGDYSTDTRSYLFSHDSPYSIVATYDQDSIE